MKFFVDKEAAERFFAIARQGESGIIGVNGKDYRVEPVREYIGRLASVKRGRR